MAPKHDVGPRRGVSAGELPRDRFDDLPKRGRVGAHRVVARPKRLWVYLVAALTAIVLLTTAGVIGVLVTGANVTEIFERSPGGSESSGAKVQAELDPTASVVVLNGTRMPGFGGIVDELITENEWGEILFSGEAASDDITISAVFYSAPEDEGAALGLAKQLGGVSVFQREDYVELGARLVVLLGSDYAGPGRDRFEPDPA